MRWSEWRKRPPVREAAAPHVLAAVDTVLGTLGADPDGECWVAWGEDAIIKWSMLVPTPPGLVTLAVRPAGGDGPRINAKLVRWSRVQIGEFSVDYQSGHRVVALSVEGIILRGADAEADAIGEFLQSLYAAIDGRSGATMVVTAPVGARRPSRAKASRREIGAVTSGPSSQTAAHAPATLLPAVIDDDEAALPDFLAQLTSPDEAARSLPAGLSIVPDLVPAPPATSEPVPFSTRQPEPIRVLRPPTLEPPAGPLGRRLAAGVPAPVPVRRPGMPGSGR